MMRTIKSHSGLTRSRGMTESVCILWVYSMHKCAGIHEAMSQLTQLYSSTSEQHVEFVITHSMKVIIHLDVCQPDSHAQKMTSLTVIRRRKWVPKFIRRWTHRSIQIYP